jgi:biofilm PGA synthesis N-glycosyltransferase PgaC
MHHLNPEKAEPMNDRYVLVTPARNEAAHIEMLIQSVAAQTILPRQWVIVSDGSTDGMDDIVRTYQDQYDFITLCRRDSSDARDFSSKIMALRKGIAKIVPSDYDFFGNLDADMSFDPDYYERIMAKFHENPRLGIAGGAMFEIVDGVQYSTLSSEDSVGGGAQFFRRSCWELIGGYPPLKMGGEDSTVEIMARMHGWQVRRFADIPLYHHRTMGTAMWSIWGRRFYQGKHFYLLGHHPLFFLLKCIYRVRERPYGIGSLFLLCGYAWAFCTRNTSELPPEVIAFLRKEQLEKLKALLRIRRCRNPEAPHYHRSQ